MMRIEIGGRHYLLYLVLPHPLKISLLSPASHARLDEINGGAAVGHFAGDAARRYDERHGYGQETQHEFPARTLVTETWAPEGYGAALELGAGSGYFTTMIARRAASVLALEPAPDMQRVLRERCARDGIDNVTVLGVTAQELREHLPPSSVDSALILQSLHHFHRRAEVFAALARVVRPGGRLFLLEPHHNLRRVARLTRKYFAMYRPQNAAGDPRQWATHDFLTRRELRTLCRDAGFIDVRISTFWYPFARRLFPDPHRRYRLERAAGAVPGLRHFAAVLALEARRAARAP